MFSETISSRPPPQDRRPSLSNQNESDNVIRNESASANASVNENRSSSNTSQRRRGRKRRNTGNNTNTNTNTNTTNNNDDDIDNNSNIDHTDNNNNINVNLNNNINNNITKCQNCNRTQSEHLLNHYECLYELKFHRVNSDEIENHRSFKHIQIPRNRIIQFDLCRECFNHLTLANKKEAKNPDNTWPGFIWSFLKDRDFHRHYGTFIWKFIPTIWRHWWLDSFRIFFDNVSIEEPYSYFVDITHDIKRWNDLNDSHLLPNLRDACNELLVPKILCPFGCSEFKHRCGTVSIDIVFQRYLPKCLLKKYLINKKAFKFIETARDDYIRKNDDYDAWLLNFKDLKIEPSIAFVNGYPQVLTCHDHDRGSKLYSIHPPRQPIHNLPSRYSDQLCHCVMKCRTVKPIQKSKYSIGFQMHEQRGSFNGIDTCNITSYRDFSFRSKLLSDCEARSILNRPDINSLLNQLVDEDVITKQTANDKKLHASELYDNFDFDPYVVGATYVPLECALQIKRDTIDSFISGTIDNRKDENGNQLDDITLRFTKYWPSILYPCQKTDKHGAMFPSVPSFNSNKVNGMKLSIIWNICSLMTSVQAIWTNIDKRRHCTSHWSGWFLVYLTKHCFIRTIRRQNKCDVFKFNGNINTIESFCSKFNRDTIKEAFNDIGDSLSVVDLTENDDGDSLEEFLLNQHGRNDIENVNVIIIDAYYIEVDGDIQDSITLHGEIFELRYVYETVL